MDTSDGTEPFDIRRSVRLKRIISTSTPKSKPAKKVRFIASASASNKSGNYKNQTTIFNASLNHLKCTRIGTF